MRRSFLLPALVVAMLSGPLAGLAAAQSSTGEPQSSGGSASGDAMIEDVTASKLFYAPTGRMMKRGEFYVAVDAFSIGIVRVGVTDRFSIGVGRPLYANTTWITPKFQIFEDHHVAVATGVLHLFAPGFGTGGVGYGVGTIGSRDNAVTAGMGWFYGKDDDGVHVGEPVLILGGERRMTRRSKFVTENYVFGDGVVLSAGGRFMRRNVTMEFGGMFIVIDNTALPGAVVNLVFHPGARKKS